MREPVVTSPFVAYPDPTSPIAVVADTGRQCASADHSPPCSVFRGAFLSTLPPCFSKPRIRILASARLHAAVCKPICLICLYSSARASTYPPAGALPEVFCHRELAVLVSDLDNRCLCHDVSCCEWRGAVRLRTTGRHSSGFSGATLAVHRLRESMSPHLRASYPIDFQCLGASTRAGFNSEH